MMMSMDSTDQKKGGNSQNVNSNITKQVNYQTASLLAGSLKNLFLRDLQNTSILNSTGLMQLPMEVKMASINDLGEGIDNLISAINRKTILDEVMSIVHGQIHPNVCLWVLILSLRVIETSLKRHYLPTFILIVPGKYTNFRFDDITLCCLKSV